MNDIIVKSFLELSSQLKKDGYVGTRRAMRLLKDLRSKLENAGYNFEVLGEEQVQVTSSELDETFVEALNRIE